MAAWYGLTTDALAWILHACDEASPSPATGDPKGFWRIDRDEHPELRHTVLTLVAFHDLEQKIRDCNGDRAKGIEHFLTQNDGEGWMLPDELRLKDYRLGHDTRADRPQPVASRLGPRYYGWQLEQGPEESWTECELHARNLLGRDATRDRAEGSHANRPLYGVSTGGRSLPQGVRRASDSTTATSPERTLFDDEGGGSTTP